MHYEHVYGQCVLGRLCFPKVKGTDYFFPSHLHPGLILLYFPWLMSIKHMLAVS